MQYNQQEIVDLERHVGELEIENYKLKRIISELEDRIEYLEECTCDEEDD